MLRFKKAILLAMASRNLFRRFLNQRYNKKDRPGKVQFFENYSKIFRRLDVPAESGFWKVKWRGTELRIPLRKDRMWLDWDIALSIPAHDLEVKDFYERRLNATPALDLFIDVGANYGTHTFLMASQGVKTIAFEPLERCVEYARSLSALNGLSPDVRRLAVGNAPGEITLAFDERATWLAKGQSTEGGGVDEGVLRETVPMTCLDALIPEIGESHLLVKIDVEGSEVSVLTGARKLISQKQPLIVFEAFEVAARKLLWDELGASDYDIRDLPEATLLSKDGFLHHSSTNFLASPKRWNSHLL